MPGLKLRCETCGTEFQAQRGTARYCGGTCRQRANRAKAQKAEPSAQSSAEVVRDEWLRLDQAIDEVVQPPLSEFKSRKRKDELAFMLLESRLNTAFRDLLRKEDANVRDRMQTEMDSNVAYQRDRADRYYEWLEESRQFNRELLDTLRNRVAAGPALTKEDWLELIEMTDAELRKWVTIGARMDKNPTVNEPADQAKRWVIENRPAAAHGQ